jgi:hypothetical protein
MHLQKGFILIALIFSLLNASAQFIDNFDGTGMPKGWSFNTGDGTAKIGFKQHNGIASIYVDATHDKLGIWWALIRRTLPGIDIKKLSNPTYVLRIETRIRVSHAPRRVNLHVNNQRTTDFHSNLMEFDISDTAGWHTISMTARDFETRIGDTVACQLALMDWGLQKYRIDLDYFKVDVVNRDSAGEDLGAPIPYHPSIADPSSFPLQLDVKHDAVVDMQFPDLNFNNWSTHGASGEYTNLLTVSGTQYVIMRWDFSALKGKKVKRSGLLEMSPYSVQRSPEFKKDFGMVHVVEILGGDPLWDEKTVTFDKLKAGLPLEKVINGQMIIDDSLTWDKNGKVFFTISKPVLQRLIDGKTLGIVIKPLGAVNASFYSKDADKKRAPRLYLEVE